MALREGIELRFAPVTHVHVGYGEGDVVRLDMLTIEEAREVIVRICDELDVCRHDLHDMRKRLQHARSQYNVGRRKHA
jgi:hypothetical protein